MGLGMDLWALRDRMSRLDQEEGVRGPPADGLPGYPVGSSV